VTYSVPSTERLLNAKRFSRLPPKSVARQEALWLDTLREGSVRALCQGSEYNSSGLTCHLQEAVRARNFSEGVRHAAKENVDGLCGHQAATTTNNSLHVNQLAGELRKPDSVRRRSSELAPRRSFL
jgi:hypothetical protein